MAGCASCGGCCAHCATTCGVMGERRLAPWAPPSSEALAGLASALFLVVTTPRGVMMTMPHQWTATHLSTQTTRVIVKPSRQFHTSTTTSTRRLPSGSKTKSITSNTGVTRSSDVCGVSHGRRRSIIQPNIVHVGPRYLHHPATSSLVSMLENVKRET